MRIMTDEELVKCKAVLDYFGVDYSGDEILLTDGNNSCIMNKKSQFGEFVGKSINSIAEAVARKLNKKTKISHDD